MKISIQGRERSDKGKEEQIKIRDATSVSSRNGHDSCLLCGERNPWSLNLSFQIDGEGVSAAFKPHQGMQGYHGILHGGVISALLDAAMTHCLFHRGVRALTGDLRVRFLAPVSCDEILNLKAWILSATPPLYLVKAKLSNGKRIMAWAEAKFMQQGNSRPKLCSGEKI